MLLPVNMFGYAVSIRWIDRLLLLGLSERGFRLCVGAHCHRRDVYLVARVVNWLPLLLVSYS